VSIVATDPTRRGAAVPPRSPVGAGKVSNAARVAWKYSFLGSLGAGAQPLLESAVRVDFEAGEVVHDVSEGPFLAIIVSGILRVAASSPEGRSATIRYSGTSDSIGLPQTLAPRVVWPNQVFQAAADGSLLRLDTEVFWKTVATRPEYVPAVYDELARSLSYGLELLSENVFAHIRHRVARHLLDLSTREEGELVVHATQQDLADAIGSVREVVSRAMNEFRNEGIVRRDRASYTITDPTRLHRIAGRSE
jgi:CRP-like cAMP-binding protein